MKKRLLSLTTFTAAALCLMSFSGCGSTISENDVQETLRSLLDDVQFETELAEVGNNALLYFSDLPEDTALQFYKASGYCADQIALFTFSDASECKDAVSSLEDYVSDLESQYASYAPEQVDKLQHAVIYPCEQFLFLCVTNDYTNASSILDALD